MATNTTVPTSINAGTTVKWTSSFDDYAASDGWTAKIYMAGLTQFAGGTGVAGTPNGTSFDFVLTPANTALLEGNYRWQIRVEKAGEEYVAEEGNVLLRPNFESAAAGSGTFAERMVAAIKARIEGRTDADVQALGIAGRHAVKIPYLELHQALNYWMNQAWLEANPGKRRTMRVKFSGVSNET